ncbi:MAG: thioesterase [Lysobacteraceae bacterium]|nr:MAG: thioesterase [Xanthomonadaceae bacterium]
MRRADPVEISAVDLSAIENRLLAMPPVAALALRMAGFDGERLTLDAPLDANANDRGCAFGGSLASLMTLAGWALVNAHLDMARVRAHVYVADSEIAYRTPLYADLRASAWLAEQAALESFFESLRRHGRGQLHVCSAIASPDGSNAAESRSRFVAIQQNESRADGVPATAC